MSTFQIVLNQLLQFFIMIVIGVSVGKIGWVKKEGLGVLSKLLSKVLLPALLLYGTYGGGSASDIVEALPMFAAIICIYVGLIVLFYIISRIVPGSQNRRSIYQALFAFGNSAMIATPLILAACPNKGKLYVFFLILVDTVFLWTCGVRLASEQSGEKKKLSINPRNFLSPTVLAVLISLVLNIFDLQIPQLAENTLRSLSNATSPICMIYLGILLYYSDVKKALTRWEIYLGMFVKMCAIPLLLGVILRMANLSAEIINTLVIIAGLPTVTIMPMLAQTYGTEGEYAASVTIITIAFSLLTMPFVAYLVMV